MLTFAEAMQAAIGLYKGRDRCFASRLSFWIERFGNTPFEQVKRDDIRDAIDALAHKPKRKVVSGVALDTDATLSNASINRFVAALGSAYKILDQHRKLKFESPLKGIARRPEAPGRNLSITVDQVRKLINVARLSKQRKLSALIAVACTSGLRMGNIQALTWGDVDLKHGLIDVARTKNGTPQRSVLPPWAIAEVARIKPENVKNHEFIFGPLNPIKAFRAALRATGLPDDWTLHHCRHIAASVLAQSGASVVTIMQALNHKSPQMAMRYSHLNTDSLRQSMAAAWGSR